MLTYDRERKMWTLFYKENLYQKKAKNYLNDGIPFEMNQMIKGKAQWKFDGSTGFACVERDKDLSGLDKAGLGFTREGEE